MPRTTSARATVGAPLGIARSTPSAPAPTTTSRATCGDTSPAGIGLPGFRPWSWGASTRSLSAPIEACRAVIDAPRRIATDRSAPATMAAPPTTRPSRTDGNGWTSRRRPSQAAGPSDVDQLPEVGDEIVDHLLTTLGGGRPDAGHEVEQGDGRDDQVTRRVASDRGRRAAAGGVDPLEVGVAEARRGAEVIDDSGDPAALRDVAHHL